MLEGQSFVIELDAARFRGEFLQCCAEIEDHLCTAIERLVELGEIKRPPFLFGQKFDRVLKSADLPGLWKHRDHAGAVLKELQPFIELRGTIGHAVMSPATIEGQDGLSWRTPGVHDWSARQAITLPEMKAALANLRRLTEKFLKQPLAGI